MLGQLGRRVGDPAVDRAVAYIATHAGSRRQLVRPLGRQLHLRHLAGAGRPGAPWACRRTIRPWSRGANWLLAYQQPCGGWGESPDSYAEPQLRGQGPATASQTAWAMLGLMAAGHAIIGAVARRRAAICSTRSATTAPGTRPEFTGTGFPQVFYLRYHLYRIYFPLMALAHFASAKPGCLPEAHTSSKSERM